MGDPSEYNDDEKSKEELRKDNELLREQVKDLGGHLSESEDLDPHVENEFLRNILEFEEMENGPKREVITVFPDGFEFPPVESMSKIQLNEKVAAVKRILAEHGFALDLAASLPDELAYEHILTEIIHRDIPLEFPEGYTLHFDGCDGYCPECFQRDFCKTRAEVWPEE